MTDEKNKPEDEIEFIPEAPPDSGEAPGGGRPRPPRRRRSRKQRPPGTKAPGT